MPKIKNKTSSNARYRSLVNLYKSNQFSELEVQARKFLLKYHNNGEVWKLLGLALLRQQRNDLMVWENAAKLLPNDAEVHFNLGNCYRGYKRFSEAINSFLTLLKIDPLAVAAHLILGLIYFDTDEDERAEQAYMAALKIDSNQVEALFNLALLYKRGGRLAEAVSTFLKAIDISPEFAEAYNSMGMTLTLQGDLKRAERAFRGAVKIKPGYLGAQYNLGLNLLGQGHTSEAITLFQSMLKINPNLAEVYCSVGDALYSQVRLSEAEVSYKDALKINPELAQAHLGLGNTLLRSGRQSESETYYQEALRLFPDYSELHFKKGQLLKNLGRGDDALKHIELAYKGQDNWRDRLTKLSEPWVVLNGVHYSSTAERDMKPHRSSSGEVELLDVELIKRSTLTGKEEKWSGAGLPPFKPLRIVLIYPPPWKILSEGHSDNENFLPPQDIQDRHFDSDFPTIPYGLMTIAAQAKRAGHEVHLFNLSTSSWKRVESVVANTEADLFGLSAYNSNRRGVGAVAQLIRQHYPDVHITAGGPFVTALPKESLHNYPEIDTVVIGEGETSFMELVERVGSEQPASGLAGTAWRNGADIEIGEERQRIKNLDELASPFDYFSNYIVMTSRGCPSKCSFCGSKTIWKRKLRFHSVDRSVELFKSALSRLPVPFVAVKDDTFTSHRRRALEICEQLTQQGMNFLWSCDTRVDSLDEELLYKMRLAGCQRISLGVESGSPEILDSMHKNITPEEVLKITAIARKYGIHVRYYMIIGNRGESPDTISQGIDLIRKGKPSFVSFSYLTLLPGTEEWDIFSENYNVSGDLFFRNDFKDFSVATGRISEWDILLDQIQCEIGKMGFDFTLTEREDIARLLPEHHAAQVELANAYLKENRVDEADDALARAEQMEFPIPDLVDNQRACIALARGDSVVALSHLERALARNNHPLIKVNHHILKTWESSDPNIRGDRPSLNDSVQASDFQCYEMTDASSEVVGMESQAISFC